MNSITIHPMEINEVNQCEMILRYLPEWFGIEQAILNYKSDIQSMDTYVASTDDDIYGFITLNYHNEFSAEVQVMAVKRPYHRKGVGQTLVQFAEQILLKKQIKLFQVKTLGPSHPDMNYQKTRDFYLKQGFLPLEENKLWGKTNPCLIMVKQLNM